MGGGPGSECGVGEGQGTGHITNIGEMTIISSVYFGKPS